MRIHDELRGRLLNWAERIISSRPPDFVVGEPGAVPYLQRWYLVKTRWGSLYLHKFCQSDDDRALHDHPYHNVSLVLSEGYYEVMRVKDAPLNLFNVKDHFFFEEVSEPFQGAVIELKLIGVWTSEGTVRSRKATMPHRIEIIPDSNPVTLFFCGPRIREWGFWCPQGWVPWTKFVTQRLGGNSIGPGCEQQ